MPAGPASLRIAWWAGTPWSLHCPTFRHLWKGSCERPTPPPRQRGTRGLVSRRLCAPGASLVRGPQPRPDSDAKPALGRPERPLTLALCHPQGPPEHLSRAGLPEPAPGAAMSGAPVPAPRASVPRVRAPQPEFRATPCPARPACGAQGTRDAGVAAPRWPSLPGYARADSRSRVGAPLIPTLANVRRVPEGSRPALIRSRWSARTGVQIRQTPAPAPSPTSRSPLLPLRPAPRPAPLRPLHHRPW